MTILTPERVKTLQTMLENGGGTKSTLAEVLAGHEALRAEVAEVEREYVGEIRALRAEVDRYRAALEQIDALDTNVPEMRGDASLIARAALGNGTKT